MNQGYLWRCENSPNLIYMAKPKTSCKKEETVFRSIPFIESLKEGLKHVNEYRNVIEL